MADQGSPHVTGFTMHDSMAAPEQPASATSGSCHWAAALLSCISYHLLYAEGSLTPQMLSTLTLSMPQFPGGLQSPSLL